MSRALNALTAVISDWWLEFLPKTYRVSRVVPTYPLPFKNLLSFSYRFNLQIPPSSRRLREDSNITQTQLATYLELDQSMVSKIENGERKPSIEMIEKLSVLFGCLLDNTESNGECGTSLEFAFRANKISNEDLEAIASINRIALNLRKMNHILRDASD